MAKTVVYCACRKIPARHGSPEGAEQGGDTMTKYTEEMNTRLAQRADYQNALAVRKNTRRGSAFVGILCIFMTLAVMFGSVYTIYKSGKFVKKEFGDTKVVRAVDQYIDTLFE